MPGILKSSANDRTARAAESEIWHPQFEIKRSVEPAGNCLSRRSQTKADARSNPNSPVQNFVAYATKSCSKVQVLTSGLRAVS
jgi:hypothetical protein